MYARPGCGVARPRTCLEGEFTGVSGKDPERLNRRVFKPLQTEEGYLLSIFKSRQGPGAALKFWVGLGSFPRTFPL